MNFMETAYPSKKNKNSTDANMGKCDVYWIGFAKALWNTSDDGKFNLLNMTF